MLGDISMALRFLGVFLLLSGFGVWAAERAGSKVPETDVQECAGVFSKLGVGFCAIRAVDLPRVSQVCTLDQPCYVYGVLQHCEGVKGACAELALISDVRTTPANLQYFKIMSGHIGCGYLAGRRGRAALLRCDLQEFKSSFKRLPQGENWPPPICHTHGLNAFTIGADAKLGKAECASDEITHPDALTLTPGSTWQMDGFVCQLDQHDLTCMNSKRHGFSVSKSRQRVF